MALISLRHPNLLMPHLKDDVYAVCISLRYKIRCISEDGTNVEFGITEKQFQCLQSRFGYSNTTNATVTGTGLEYRKALVDCDPSINPLDGLPAGTPIK